MFEALWGFKTVSLFDVWSIEHFLTGISVGHAVKKGNRKHMGKISPHVDLNHKGIIRFDVAGVLLLGFLWETFEHYLEEGLWGEKVVFWFQGVEHWSNRLISDPLLLVLGYLVSVKYPQWVIPARMLSLAWFITHVFIFPHSMYLHTLLAG